MDKVRSSDGTSIAFDRLGEGTPLVLVSGASTTRAVHTELAELLVADFTVPPGLQTTGDVDLDCHQRMSQVSVGVLVIIGQLAPPDPCTTR